MNWIFKLSATNSDNINSYESTQPGVRMPEPTVTITSHIQADSSLTMSTITA